MLPNKILITSPEKLSQKGLFKKPTDAASFEKLKKHGFELIKFPTIKIVQSKNCKALDIAIHKINSYDYLIFTSKNSVNFFMQRFFAAGKTKEDIKRIKICAVGTKTAEEIKRWKVKVDLIPAEFNAEGLVKEIVKGFEGSRLRRAAEAARGQGFKKRGSKCQSKKVFEGLRFLLLRGGKAREILPEKIRKLGGKIDSPVLYETIKPEINNEQIKKILDQKFSAVVFTSASAFNNFMEIIDEKADEFLKNTLIAVIGPVTAEAVKRAGLSVSIIPRTATIESMADEIIKYFKKNKK